MKNEKVYIEILKMIDREKRLLGALNAVRQSIENEDDGCIIKYNIYRVMHILEESQEKNPNIHNLFIMSS